MQVLQIVILAIFFIVCGVLIFLILIQSGRGGGLGVLGGGGSQSAFGSSTMDVVTKATWWALGFFVLAVLAAIAFSDTGPKLPDTPGLDSGLAPLDGAVPDAPPAEEAGQPDAEPVAPADPE